MREGSWRCPRPAAVRKDAVTGSGTTMATLPWGPPPRVPASLPQTHSYHPPRLRKAPRSYSTIVNTTGGSRAPGSALMVGN